ncbi:diacylglycerol/lipid kinase family protein [Rubripirellula lacrimiformis]|uniref:diacylglycerol/lipid kinase family protein n=1 Tax=Rubripirellula lacrimiformis TaxID=1930273 RepID=UPI001FE6B439|nr:diacylglycerol kinase family protein [Rubripirellula lacrimiformis]
MNCKTVFWNSGSGRSAEVGQVRQAMGSQSNHWIDLAETSDLSAAVKEAVANGCESVVAVGGDGTVNAIVNALMAVDAHARPTLAIIPLGTANDFAGTLNIPDDIAEAASLVDHPACPVDIVRISGTGAPRYYANMAAGGNCVRVSEAMTDEVKARWGSLSYIRGAVDVLPDMHTFRIDATCDDEKFTSLDCWAVLVANGKTNAGRIEVAPLASPTDGLFDVIIIRDGTVGDMVEIVTKNLMGDFLDSEQIIFRQVRSLQLQSSPTMRFTLDGEVFDDQPVQFDVVAGAIRIHCMVGI